MTQHRRQQWTQRLERLHTLIDKYLSESRHDRARRAYYAVQRVYDRWGSEVFMAESRPTTTAGA